MIHTTTYVHVHDGDAVTVAGGATPGLSGDGLNVARTSIEFGSGSTDAQVVVFLDVTMAQELARSILAAFPLPVTAVEPCRYDAPCPKCVEHNAARIAEHAGRRTAERDSGLSDAAKVDKWLRGVSAVPAMITVVDHTHQCRDCRAEVDCDGDPCVFDGSCDACS